jgi:hypothetical protein
VDQLTNLLRNIQQRSHSERQGSGHSAIKGGHRHKKSDGSSSPLKSLSSNEGDQHHLANPSLPYLALSRSSDVGEEMMKAKSSSDRNTDGVL